jgi:phenylacetate-CoA ligase
LIDPVQGLRFALEVRGLLIDRLKWSAYLAFQMLCQPRMPFLPLETLKRIQARRVRSMISHAYRTVPYYKETLDRLGLRPEAFRSAEDLARLPVLEPHHLQTDPEYFISKDRPLSSYVKLRTGGSTGDPRVVYHSKHGILQNAGHGERERPLIARILGRRLGYRETVLISYNSTCEKLQAMSRSSSILPAPLVIRRQYLSLMDSPEVNVPQLNAFKPDLIETYGSYLAMLFTYLAKSGAQFHRPKVLRFSSDGLPENARRLIAERFNIPVFSAYQANEALKLGFECEHHRGYHLNVDLYPLRIADSEGRTLPDGQTGEVIISNTVNDATVLLNYRLGDLAAMIPGGCPCGRTLPMLTFPPGRSDDLLELPSGQIIHPQFARTVFTIEQDVYQYQIIQTSRTHLAVKAIVSKSADLAALKERVLARFAERFGPEMTIDFSFVDTIDRTKGGKFRPVISLRGQGLDA